MAFVVFALLFWVTLRRAHVLERGSDLLPFQRRFADLPSALQRDYRELREGFTEAGRIRGAEGKWPDVARLAEEGVPPFAGDGVDGKVREWTLLQSGPLVLYVGRPREARPTLLLQMIEPASGDRESANARTPIDETHQRLSNGMLLHVSTWYRDSPLPELRADPSFRPENAGFTQMVAR
jgi:hypothetical protein